uniref:Very-long-chain 3-oxoacyl-CoA synthase n=1 Tax=Caenorhabditis tropicalis TaxID=1561998 RepID=A0A1I7ULP0_9PELO
MEIPMNVVKIVNWSFVLLYLLYLSLCPSAQEFLYPSAFFFTFLYVAYVGFMLDSRRVHLKPMMLRVLNFIWIMNQVLFGLYTYLFIEDILNARDVTKTGTSCLLSDLFVSARALDRSNFLGGEVLIR